MVTLASREEWLAARRIGLRMTATDYAKVAGIAPPGFGSAWDVLADKLLEVDVPDEPEVWDPSAADKHRGNVWEPRLRADYEAETGAAVDYEPYMMLVHPEIPWVVGSPDGLVGPDGGFEGKTSRIRDGWARRPVEIREWSDDAAKIVPPYYASQCYWLMLASGRAWWDLVDGDRFGVRIFRIYRDEKTIAAMLDHVTAWRDRYLVRREPLPIDDSAACRAAVAVPRAAGKRPADEIELELIARWSAARRREQDAEAEKKRLANELILRIGDAEGLAVGSGSITLVRTKGRRSIDYDGILGERPDLRPLIESHTTTGAPSHSLRPHRLEQE